MSQLSTEPRGREADSPRPSGRTRALHALDWAGVLDRMFWLRARLGLQEIAVLAYHRVGHPKDAGELDPGVFEAEPQELADQLDFLSARCTVVSTAELRRFIQGKRLPENPVLVTFDDGYADAHQVALPILLRAGIPATFFVATAFPDGGRIFWWDRVWLLVRRCQVEPIELQYPAPLSLHPVSAPGEAARRVCTLIKRTKAIDMGRLWDELERKTRVSLCAAEERAIAAKTLMGWSAVRSMRQAGMDVQSHSHAHQVLNTLSPDEARRDLIASSRILREALGADVFSVAYPVGYPLLGDHRRAALGAGMDLGFTNCTGICSLRRLDPLNIPRIAMSTGLSLAHYKAKLLLDRRTQAAATAPAITA